MASVKDRNTSDKSTASSAWSAESLRDTVPEELQHAIIGLLETCKENDIEIPDQLGSAFLNALDKSNRERAAAIMSFEERVMTEKKEFKKAISDNPIVIRANETRKKLHSREPDFSVRIKDGYFKYIERVDKSKPQNQRSARLKPYIMAHRRRDCSKNSYVR